LLIELAENPEQYATALITKFNTWFGVGFWLGSGPIANKTPGFLFEVVRRALGFGGMLGVH